MSSVHEMDCLAKETVSVSGRSVAQSSVALTRRDSSKRECAGCEGSRVILPALLLTLNEYSSWSVCVCVCVRGGYRGGVCLSKVINTEISREMCYVCHINMYYHKMLYFICIRYILQPFFKLMKSS